MAISSALPSYPETRSESISISWFHCQPPGYTDEWMRACIQSSNYQSIHSFIESFICPFIDAVIRASIHVFVHALILSSIHSFMYMYVFIYSFIQRFIYLFTFTYSFHHSSLHAFAHSVSCTRKTSKQNKKCTETTSSELQNNCFLIDCPRLFLQPLPDPGHTIFPQSIHVISLPAQPISIRKAQSRKKAHNPLRTL